MGSASPDESSQKAIEADLVETGDKLLAIPSSTDELITLLEKAEELLARVWQRPPLSTCFALLSSMKALITDDILHHTDLKVQVVVASCFNELTRITCPDPPYDDDVMMGIFPLFMIAIRQLSNEPGQNSAIAVRVIKTMAKIRSFLMLLDMDTDGHFVIEMFQLFLSNIRLNQLSDVFQYMERIMTSVIQESDEISSELLSPLLSSVKMENKNSSPISWELGKKVLENCATKLSSYLREAVKEMNLNLADYAVIVTSICYFISHESSNGKNMISSKVSRTVGDESQLDGFAEDDDELCDPETNDGNRDDNSLGTPKARQLLAQSGADSGSHWQRRGRKSNSVTRPEEGYENVWSRGGKYSDESWDDCYDDKEDSDLVSERGKASVFSNSAHKGKNNSFHEGSFTERDQLKKKEKTFNQPNNSKFSSTIRKKCLQTKEKDKKAIGELSNIKAKKRKGVLGDTLTGGEHGLLPNEKQKKKTATSQKYLHKDVNKKSKRPYGEKLVTKRIQVWWPMDETFYPGTVTAFDPETKKHTILYDDNETEILNLRKETWGLFSAEQPPQGPQKEEANLQSPAQHSVKVPKKATRRKAIIHSSKPHHTVSSTKRLKSENCSAFNYVGNLKPDNALLNGESENEAKIAPNDDINSLQESETFSEKMKTGRIVEDVTKV